MSASIAIGCGSGYAEDRLEPAVDLANTGLVDYMAFDCLAERTLALAQIRRMQDGSGQDQRIARVVEDMTPFLASGRRIIGNFGAANPDAASGDVVLGLRKAGLDGARVGVIRGDDVRDTVLALDLALPERQTTARAMATKIVSAHAYIGAEWIVPLLEAGAQFVLGGRLADPSLFVGPICHELGWALDDWDKVGIATLAGHLLECGTHGSGGNFEDPPYRVIDDPANVGQPFALVSDDGIVVSKTPNSGGAIDRRTVKTQLLYEIHDPAAYLTPDVAADFSEVTVEEVGADRVRVVGARGRARPAALKVLVGLDLGWKGVGEISYGGPGCVDRARRAEEMFRTRLEPFASDIDELRVDLHGMTTLFGPRADAPEPIEVRFRAAARCATKEAAQAVAKEVELLYFGPAAAGGATMSVVPAIGVTPAYLDRSHVKIEHEVVVA